MSRQATATEAPGPGLMLLMLDVHIEAGAVTHFEKMNANKNEIVTQIGEDRLTSLQAESFDPFLCYLLMNSPSAQQVKVVKVQFEVATASSPSATVFLNSLEQRPS